MYELETLSNFKSLLGHWLYRVGIYKLYTHILKISQKRKSLIFAKVLLLVVLHITYT